MTGALRSPAWQAGLATATAVGLQVLLPRWFSVLLWYHLGFLAVSLALLGFAAGGLVVHRRAAASGRAGGALDLPTLGTWAALATLAALLAVVRLPVDPSRLGASAGEGGLLLLIGLVLALPFALLGTLACSALDRAADRIGAVYAATFVGGAAGAVLCLAALEAFGLRRAGALLALLPLLGALKARPLRAAAPLALAAAVLLAPEAWLPLLSRKHFPAVPPEQVLEERSDAFSHVTFYENPDHHGLWAPPPGYSGELPESVGVAIDAWAITFITRRSGPEDHPAFAPYHTASLAFEGAPAGFEALVVGAGGGWDVLAALQAGAGHVTAVEINRLIVDAVRGRYADYSGGLYHDPRVTVRVAEGRHFLEHDQGLYDRIVLAGVDTFAATQAGAFALAENYLYTVEAFDAYLRRLKPGGVLSLTRWWYEPPRQALRLALTAAAALRARGVAEPMKRLFLAAGTTGPQSFLMLKHGADFQPAELDALVAAGARRAARPVFAWDRPSHPVLVQALSAPDPEAWAERYPYRVDPATDDRPFFFEHGRWASLFRTEGDWIHDRVGGQEVLAVTFVLLALLSAPLLWLARSGRSGRPAPAGTALPFALLGLGYLLVELPLMQRLALVLGHPVLAVAVVLVALLLGSGVGSWLAGRLSPARAPLAALACALAVGGVLAPGLGTFATWAGGLGGVGRIAAVVAWVGLPGVLLGLCFPLAVRLRLPRHPSLVPTAFLWNGVAGVLAGPTAVALALSFGFRPTLFAGAACYLAAAAALARGGPLTGAGR